MEQSLPYSTDSPILQPNPRLPLGQTSEQDLPSPSASLCAPTSHPLIGRLSQTEEEARLPGRVGLPGTASHSVTPPVPETLQTLDLS